MLSRFLLFCFVCVIKLLKLYYSFYHQTKDNLTNKITIAHYLYLIKIHKSIFINYTTNNANIFKQIICYYYSIITRVYYYFNSFSGYTYFIRFLYTEQNDYYKHFLILYGLRNTIMVLRSNNTIKIVKKKNKNQNKSKFKILEYHYFTY